MRKGCVAALVSCKGPSHRPVQCVRFCPVARRANARSTRLALREVARDPFEIPLRRFGGAGEPPPPRLPAGSRGAWIADPGCRLRDGRFPCPRRRPLCGIRHGYFSGRDQGGAGAPAGHAGATCRAEPGRPQSRLDRLRCRLLVGRDRAFDGSAAGGRQHVGAPASRRSPPAVDARHRGTYGTSDAHPLGLHDTTAASTR